MPKPKLTVKERLLSKIKINPKTGCWEWIGAKPKDGYGRMGMPDRTVPSAHCISYQIFKGEIPGGMVIDHLCRNKGCVNPDHLEVVTQRENVLRGKIGQKTHCKNGHPFTDARKINELGNPIRICTECVRQRRMTPEARAKDALKHRLARMRKHHHGNPGQAALPPSEL